MTRWLPLAALCAAACGSPDTPAETPKTTSSAAPSGPAEDCIAKANAGDQLPEDAPARISVRHIIVKHADAAGAGDAVTRSRGEACLRALEALDKLKAGAEFGAIVGDYSDEAGAATREGSLGEIKPEDVAPPFAAAAFALEPGQVSFVVESKHGFHIIQRTD